MLTQSKIKKLISKLPDHYIPVGSFNRGKKNPNDIDLISLVPINKVEKEINKYFKSYKIEEEAKGDKEYFVHLNKGKEKIPLNIWYSKKDELPYMYFWLSYPQIFVLRVRGAFKNKGYKLNQYGLFKGKKKIKISDPKDIFDLLNELGYNYKYRTPKEQENKEIKAGNIFTDAWNFFKKGAEKVGEVVQKGVNIIKNIPEALKGVRLNYPPKYREMKERYGNIGIESMSVCKDPIEKFIDLTIDLISNGEFEKNKQSFKYDDMFHLYLRIKLKSGVILRMEKNEVLNLDFMDERVPHACLPVNINPNETLTINMMLDRVYAVQGDDLFRYDGIDNNCQVHIKLLLEYSNLLTPELNDFIMQNTQEVVGKLPELTKAIMKGATNLAGIWNVLLYGAKLIKKLKKKYKK